MTEEVPSVVIPALGLWEGCHGFLEERNSFSIWSFHLPHLQPLIAGQRCSKSTQGTFTCRVSAAQNWSELYKPGFKIEL